MEQNTIIIFLASSEELKEDRVWFGDFVQGINKIYQERGKGVDVFKWEFFDAANNDVSKQGEYDNEIRKSNMFLALFHTKAGKFTLHEYDVAMDTYRKTKKFPKVYVYFRALQEGEEETPELLAFKAELSKDSKEYFWITYSTRDQLHLHFLQQLLRVENSLDKLKYEEGKVTLEGMHVADIDNLPFAKENKDYQRISAELLTLPGEIDGARQYADEHPDNDYMRSELQKKLNRYNALKEEFAGLQNTLFDTSQRIAAMQREQLSDKLRRATEAFESGDLGGANALLREISIDAKTHYDNMNQQRELVHQDIEAFLLQAKTVMAEVNTPIKERIEQVQDIYKKANQWAEVSGFPKKKYCSLLEDYSEFLRIYGIYDQALKVSLYFVSLCENLYGKEDLHTSKVYDSFGILYIDLGYYSEALEYFKKSLGIRECLLGKNHPDTAESYNNVGAVYRYQGDYSKALEFSEKALAIKMTVLGTNHAETAKSYNSIANVWHDIGDYPKALDYLNKALNIWEGLFGTDHPKTVMCYSNIGAVYYSQGDYPMALHYNEKALNIHKRLFGTDHPVTAISFDILGLIYREQGDYSMALYYLRKSLEVFEKNLESINPDNPDTAKSCYNIGEVYRRQGDYSKAMVYLKRSMDIRERVLAADHPDTANSYYNIGLVYYNQGHYHKALEYYEKVLEIRERKLGPEHIKTKMVRENIERCRKKMQD